MAQRQYNAGNYVPSPMSATPGRGKSSHPPASSAASTPAQQYREHEQQQQQQQQSQAQSHPDSQTPTTSGGQHKRVYQACIPCRRRKVRCDLGSVDNPHDPPCVRCRRESKDCFFSATRRKRKVDDGEQSDADDYVARNGRRRLHADASPPPPPTDLDPRFGSEAPLTPGGSHGRTQPLRRPDVRSRSRRESELEGDGDAKLENIEAQTAMRRAVYNPHDALDLLYKAATDRSAIESSCQTNTSTDFVSPAANLRAREESIVSATTAPAYQITPHEVTTASDLSRPRSVPSRLDVEQQQQQNQQQNQQQHQQQQQQQNQQHPQQQQLPQHQLQQEQEQQRQRQQQPFTHQHPQQQEQRTQAQFIHHPRPNPAQQTGDPGLAQQSDMQAQPGYAQALRAWSRFRFVRAGWFTAQEAIEYIDYYYKYLSPMTPISPPTYSDPASHLTLLTEEPILTVTLLTIASRYRQMPGTGGHCRSHAIPEQLWTYLRGMIERCLWGQEAFGGGFCGSGGAGSSCMLVDEEAETSSTAPWRGLRKGSLRTLGTIESLLILTEWHPRALHFPPQEATDELMLPEHNSGPTTGSEDASRNVGAGFGGKRIESWLEPAWRSDRMCWMLLSVAMGLAYELGVFDDVDEMLRDDTVTRPEYMDEAYRTRANRIKRLLLIYTSQLAGRLGWTSMSPEHLRKADPAVTRRRTMVSTEGNTPSSASISNGFNYVPDLELDDQIIHCWAGISNAMHVGNQKLFKSRKYTTEIIQSGKYVELLREYSPLLKDWYREFELFRLPQFIRHILNIEYEYVRIYVNSLSLQAVVERCTSNAGQTANNGSHNSNNGNGSGGAAGNGQAGQGTTHLSPQTLINYGKLPLGQLGGFTVHDQEYVREVVSGCRNLLRTVVEGLLPGGYLKHAPVRTYFRIISGAMFLLKTFALGAPRSDVKMSIDLMDACVEALRNCVVDDVHLGIRFADLLETLTSRLRNRFIQAPTLQQSAGKGQSPLHEGVVPGGGGAETSSDTVDWVGRHAQRLRDGLSGQYRPTSLEAEGSNTNNISATPFDLSAGNFHYLGAPSIGPSPPSAHVDHHGAAAVPGTDMNLLEDWTSPGNEMWYLPTGPAFFQNMGGDSSVAMTAEGVNVGGLDLLEYMAMDPVQFSSIDAPGSAAGGNAEHPS